jgi:hypothetical protein
MLARFGEVERSKGWGDRLLERNGESDYSISPNLERAFVTNLKTDGFSAALGVRQ